MLAHALWTGLGIVALRRRTTIGRGQAAAAVALAVLPDVVHALPHVVWTVGGDGTLRQLLAYATAVPGSEPRVPPWVDVASHHLHCIAHSAPAGAAAGLLLLPWWASVRVALAAWWAHIAIDVPTHSSAYYASPVLYPFTPRGFDGVAWNEPWMLALNYGALAAAAAWLAWTRPAHARVRRAVRR